MSLSALVLLPLPAVLVGLVLSGPDDRDGVGRASGLVPCSEAPAFGGATLPDGARPVGTCTLRGFQDTHGSASFRMPRTGVRNRLAHTSPDAPGPGTAFCADDDADLWPDPDSARGVCRRAWAPTPSA
ncbi:hypothetical protein ACP4IX_26365 [Streptomyces sp. WG5]